VDHTANIRTDFFCRGSRAADQLITFSWPWTSGRSVHELWRILCPCFSALEALLNALYIRCTYLLTLWDMANWQYLHILVWHDQLQLSEEPLGYQIWTQLQL